MKFMWNGVEKKLAFSDAEAKSLIANGYIEVPDFNGARILPSAQEVKNEIDKSTYQTKEMTKKKTKKV